MRTGVRAKVRAGATVRTRVRVAPNYCFAIYQNLFLLQVCPLFRDMKSFFCWGLNLQDSPPFFLKPRISNQGLKKASSISHFLWG